jgi:hypothetical protein
MTHPFMESVANGLAEHGIATLRYQFPYMEQGLRRPEAPHLAQAAVRAGVAEASRLAPELALVAGGKSYGGRMTSQAQALSPLPGVRGLVFHGFPLHPAGRPSVERGSHLFEVKIPMLFLQGTCDASGLFRPGWVSRRREPKNARLGGWAGSLKPTRLSLQNTKIRVVLAKCRERPSCTRLKRQETQALERHSPYSRKQGSRVSKAGNVG